MKANKIILKAFAVTSLFLMAACSSNSDKDTLKNTEEKNAVSHVQHESLQQNFAHKEIIILKNSYIVEKQNEDKLKEIMNDCLIMKNAFIVSDSKAIDNAAFAMQNHVKEVDVKTLKERRKKPGYNTLQPTMLSLQS